METQRPIVTRAQAKVEGAKTFYTGRPCSKGHDAPRRTDNWSCVVCARESNNKGARTSYWNDPEKARAIRRDSARKIRATVEGLLKHRESHRISRSTPHGLAASRKSNRESMRRWRARVVAPIVDSIMTTVSLLKSDEQRAQYASWLLVLADNDYRLRDAVRDFQVDSFIGTYSDI
jgi:hypothetical protein